MLKLKTCAKCFLSIPVLIISLWVVNMISFMGPIVLAGVPLDKYPQAFLAYLNTSTLPIIMGEAKLGIVFRGYPEIHNAYRNQREGFLERVAMVQPNRRVRAVIVLNDFYSPEKMADIIDPNIFTIIGITAAIPRSLTRGSPAEWSLKHFTMGGGLSCTTLTRGSLPSDTSEMRVLHQWLDIYQIFDIEGFLSRQEETLSRWREELKILKTGHIPVGYHFEDDAIFKMTPEERLKRKDFLHWISTREELISELEVKIEEYRKWLPSMGIYAVTVEGSASKVNTLRKRTEIDLVDPLLFQGVLGIITEGSNNLRLHFSPTRPDVRVDE
ncbi:MAG: hypothetical protein DDT22_01390 [candidate division WS2 bacterium]|nr:hypothetical protein [Candidatus Lithacetigena glycinireducens]